MTEADAAELIKPFLGYGVVGVVAVVEAFIIRSLWQRCEALHDEITELQEKRIGEALLLRDALLSNAHAQDKQNALYEGVQSMLRSALERPR